MQDCGRLHPSSGIPAMMLFRGSLASKGTSIISKYTLFVAEFMTSFSFVPLDRSQLEISLHQGCEAVLTEVHGIKLRPWQKHWRPGLHRSNFTRNGFPNNNSQPRFSPNSLRRDASAADCLSYQTLLYSSLSQPKVLQLLRQQAPPSCLQYGAYRGFAAGRVKHRSSLAESALFPRTNPLGRDTRLDRQSN